MHLTAWVTLAALAVYLWTGINVARARTACKVPAPAMDGPPEFQRTVRVQANTLEQLPMLLAPLWMCAFFLSDTWAAAGGLLWCVARVVYAIGYYQAPNRRELGFILGMVASALLIVGTIAGLVLH